jgi:DMSO/TMAO reductase YedYZ heme-binding membrane subunit
VYEKLKILHSTGATIVPDNAVAILERLYSDLGALDRTAAALLTFDALLITASVFATQGGNPANINIRRRLALVVICVALVSAGLCLWVAQISYPFWDKVAITHGGTGLDFVKEFEALDGEIRLRTTLYRIAWTLSSLIVVVLFLYFSWTLYKDLKEFMGRWRGRKPVARESGPSEGEGA